MGSICLRQSLPKVLGTHYEYSVLHDKYEIPVKHNRLRPPTPEIKGEVMVGLADSCVKAIRLIYCVYTCLNQHCFTGERGTLTSKVNNCRKCSKTFGIDCRLNCEGSMNYVWVW